MWLDSVNINIIKVHKSLWIIFVCRISDGTICTSNLHFSPPIAGLFATQLTLEERPMDP